MNWTEDLERLEFKLVEKRRDIVTSIIVPDADRLNELVDIQRYINAVKSAIEDEKSRGPSVYEDPDTKV